MQMVTKVQLDTALEAWTEARIRAVLEQSALGDAMASYGTLIASLRANGHAWIKAKAEFDRLSNDHRERLHAALLNMDEKCEEYQRLYAEFNRDQT